MTTKIEIVLENSYILKQVKHIPSAKIYKLDFWKKATEHGIKKNRIALKFNSDKDIVFITINDNHFDKCTLDEKTFNKVHKRTLNLLAEISINNCLLHDLILFMKKLI